MPACRYLFPANPGRLALPLFLLCAVLLARPCAATPGEWDFTNSLTSPRELHTATLLPSGQVLVAAGGSDENNSSVTAELYDPATGIWSATGSLSGRRHNQSATLLPNGMVLVAGGYDTSFGGGTLATCELYNPAAGTWSTTGSMHYARSGHRAVLLNNGKVLAIGAGGAFDTLGCELYDPATGTWTVTGSLNSGRRIRHSATLLLDGKVLVAGGGFGDYIASAELYDPATGIWTLTGSLNVARSYHTATLLPDGKVLVAGGDNLTGSLTSAELYDPATGMWTLTGSLASKRSEHTATLLPSGQVLVAGGISFSTSAELYDPSTGMWSATGSLNQGRHLHTATLLPDGTVLAAGGQTSGVFATETAELYGSPVELATHVAGRGAFDNQGNEVTFKFSVTQGDDRFLGYFAFCDPAADVCIRAKVSSLTITGNSADFSGTIHTKGRITGTFDVSVTDNGSPGTLDTISINLSNGYSAGGMLTSGGIRIY